MAGQFRTCAEIIDRCRRPRHRYVRFGPHPSRSKKWSFYNKVAVSSAREIRASLTLKFNPKLNFRQMRPRLLGEYAR
jgi:hypothetical protein